MSWLDDPECVHGNPWQDCPDCDDTFDRDQGLNHERGTT